MTRGSLSFLALFLFLTPQPSSASEIARIGAEVRAMKTATSMGILFGWRYAHRVSERFSIGGAGYTGQLTGTQTGSLSFGGLMGSYTGQFTSTFGMELSLLAGGGGGFTADGVKGGGIALEPNLSFVFVLGRNVRAVIDASYVWLPSSADFSGYGGGLRFEFGLGSDEPKS